MVQEVATAAVVTAVARVAEMEVVLAEVAMEEAETAVGPEVELVEAERVAVEMEAETEVG